MEGILVKDARSCPNPHNPQSEGVPSMEVF